MSEIEELAKSTRSQMPINHPWQFSLRAVLIDVTLMAVCVGGLRLLYLAGPSEAHLEMSILCVLVFVAFVSMLLMGRLCTLATTTKFGIGVGALLIGPGLALEDFFVAQDPHVGAIIIVLPITCMMGASIVGIGFFAVWSIQHLGDGDE